MFNTFECSFSGIVFGNNPSCIANIVSAKFVLK